MTIEIQEDELADRIASWGSYITKYPNSLETHEAKTYYSRYMNIYTQNGLDNTLAYDRKNGKLLDDVRKSYERYMEKYPNTTAFSIIKRLYDILSRNNFTRNSEVKQYQKSILQSIDAIAPSQGSISS